MKKEEVINKLKEVVDPELGMDIVSLGFVKEIKVEESKVYLKIKFTTPFCPFADIMLEEIKKRFKDVEIEVML